VNNYLSTKRRRRKKKIKEIESRSTKAYPTSGTGRGQKWLFYGFGAVESDRAVKRTKKDFPGRAGKKFRGGKKWHDSSAFRRVRTSGDGEERGQRSLRVATTWIGPRGSDPDNYEKLLTRIFWFKGERRFRYRMERGKGGGLKPLGTTKLYVTTSKSLLDCFSRGSTGV